MSIYLTAIVKAKAEHQEAIYQMLQQMVTESRKEKACIQYDLHQGREDKNIFVFYEIWESQEGLDAHNQQPYLQEFLKIIPEKLQEPPIVYMTDKI